MGIINDHTEEFKNAMREAITTSLEAMGLQAESYAKLELENSPRRIDTGLLRNSITYALDGQPPAIGSYSSDDGSKTGSYSGAAPHESNKSVQSVYIGTNVEYGIYVHEGTDRMAPNRFLRNAVEKNASQYKAIAESMMR